MPFDPSKPFTLENEQQGGGFDAAQPFTLEQIPMQPGVVYAAPRKRTLGERFADNVSDSLNRGTLLGAGANALSAYVGDRIDRASANPGVYAPLNMRGRNAEDAASYNLRSEADPFYKSNHPVLAGLATLGGQLTGSLPTPESVFGGPGKGPLLRRALIFGGTNMAADVPTQGLNIASGEQQHYDPLRTGASGLLGAALPAAGDAAKFVGKKLGPVARDLLDGILPKKATGFDPGAPFEVETHGPAVDTAKGPTFDPSRSYDLEIAPKTTAPPVKSPFTDEAHARTVLTDLIGEGVQFTSGRRTQADQERLIREGKHPAKNSLHLDGRALDIVPPPGMTMKQVEAKLRSSGINFTELLNEGDHIHVSWGGKGKRPGVGPGGTTSEPTNLDFPDIVPEEFSGAGQVIDPTARDLTDEALDALRSGRRVDLGQGPSLLDYISRNGGLRDLGGELSAMDAERWHKGRPFQPKLVRDTGASLEEMAQRAHEAGYFPEVAAGRMDGGDNMQAVDSAKLLDAIRRELAGSPRYAKEADPRAADLAAHANDLEQMLGELGIDLHGQSNAQIKKSLNDYFRQPNRADPVLDDTVFGARSGKRRGSVLSGPDASSGPAARRGLDGRPAERPGGLLGVRSDSAAEPAFLDQAHADLYRLGQRANAGQVDLAEAEHLAGSMGRFMDWTDVPGTAERPWTPQEREALAQGNIPPHRMIEAAQDFVHDAHDRHGSTVSYYDPDRYHEVMAANARQRPASERVRLADGEAEQSLIPGVSPLSDTQRAIAERIKTRMQRRGSAAPAEGSLFDQTPKTGDLFGMFAGGRSRTADQAARRTAEQMEAAGASREAIRLKTGWLRGDEGKWRYEFSDHNAVLRTAPRDGFFGAKKVGLERLRELADGHGVARLDSIIDHPALFEAYPALRKIAVVVEDIPGWAEFRPDEVGGAELVIGRSALDLAPDDIRGLILHEIQHAIQDREGFAFGSNSGAEGGADAYWRAAGEVEARNTQARRNLDERARERMSPDDTRDVPRENTLLETAASYRADYGPEAFGPPRNRAEGDLGPLASRNNDLRKAPRVGAVPSSNGKVGTAAYQGQRVAEIADRLTRLMGVPVRSKRMTLRKALGEYHPDKAVVRQKSTHDYNVRTHEIGHHLDNMALPSVEAAKQANATSLKGLAYAGADPKHLLEEGFAEFFRWYMTNPAHAQKVAPKFYADFEAALAQDRPDLAKGLTELRDAYQAFLAAPSSGVVAANIVSREKSTRLKQYAEVYGHDGPAATVAMAVDDAYTALIDRFRPLAVATSHLQRVAAENGKPAADLKTAKNPYRLARMASGAYASGHMDITQGVRPHGQLDPRGPSLQAALRKALGNDWSPDAIKNFDAYLISRRMVHEWDRYASGELERAPDALSQMAHRQTIKDFDAAHPHWAEAAKMVYTWQDELWRKRFEAGLIGRTTYERGKLQHPDYVPAQRDLSDTTRAPGRATGRGQKFAGGVQQFKGSDRPWLSPVQTMMQEAFELNAVIAKNEALKALEDLAKHAGKGSAAIVETIPAKELAPVHVNLIEAAEAEARKRGLDERDHAALMTQLEEAFGEDGRTTIFKSQPITERGEPIVYAWRNGERVALRLPDGEFGKQMYEALAGMQPQQKSILIEALAAISNVQRAGITTNPAFQLRNFIRDQLSAWMLTDVGYKPVVSGARGLASELTRGATARRYSHMGGLMGGANVSALKQTRNLSPKALAPLPHQTVPKLGVGAARGVMRLTELSETGTRLGVFRNAFNRAKKQGLNDFEAAQEGLWEARDYFDVDLHGSKMMAAKRILPFFNANLQGMRKAISVGTAGGQLQRLLAPLGKAAPQSPAERAAFVKAYKLWAKMAALGVMGAGLSALYMRDPEFREFDDRERATYWFVKTGDGWAKIPKPFELAALSNIFERATERFYGADPTAWERMRKGLAEILLPPVQTPAITVPFEVASNKDYAGRPIIPDNLRGKVDPVMQFNSYTSELGKMLGRMTGTSPAIVDHALNGFFGTWMRDAQHLSNLTRPGQREAMSASDIPAFGTLVGAPERGTDSAAKFWGYMASTGGKMTEAEGSFRTLIKSDDPNAAVAYLKHLDAPTRGYVLSQVFSEKGSGKVHPLERARAASSVLSQMRRDLASGQPVMGVNGRPISLTPEQRRDADRALARLQMAELHNGLKGAGVPGWQQQDFIARRAYMDALNSASPQLKQMLRLRMAVDKVPTPPESARVWPLLERRLENLTAPQLSALIAKERATSPATRLDEALKRAPRKAQAAQ